MAIRHLYFSFYKNQIKNKNVHFLSPILIPKYTSLPKKKIVTVHDFYVFDKEYINKIYYGTKNPFKKIFISKLRKANLMDLRKAYKNLYRYDHILVGNENVKNELVNRFGVNDDNITISYYIIPDKFNEINYLKNPSKKVIGYINSFPSNKLVKLVKFIEIFKEINDPDLELRIYGYNFPLLDLIKNDTRIKYFGFLPEDKIAEMYNTFDVYLSTSTIEGFGFPIMQAKACKVPVLCYDGDIPNITKRNTLLWNDENLEEIIKNRSWEKLDVEKAYLDADECRADKVVPKIIEVYKKVFE